MRYPSAVDRNIYLAYIRKEGVTSTTATVSVKRGGEAVLDAINLNWDLHYPESLVELCIKTIAENWPTLPLFRSIPVPENRSLLADVLDFEALQLAELSAHIKVDPLWRRMYESKWPVISNSKKRPWIELYMEKYLSESLETLRPVDFVAEKVKNLVELCSPFVCCLTIDRLEVRVGHDHDTLNDHIPFDIVLENLNQLKSLSITYDCRTIGTQFYLTCTNISDSDIKKFTRGLTQTDLREFKFHSSKLEPPMLKQIGLALDKNTSLVSIEMPNCRFGDAGLVSFCSILTHDSLPNVRHLGLSNNFISPEGATLLANILRRRKLDSLDLKLNPILAEGANELLALAGIIEVTSLNISSCSFDESVEEALLFVLRNNKRLRRLNIAINKLGEELGTKIHRELAHNRVLREFDVRGAGMSHRTKRLIDGAILENREKNNTIHQ